MSNPTLHIPDDLWKEIVNYNYAGDVKIVYKKDLEDDYIDREIIVSERNIAEKETKKEDIFKWPRRKRTGLFIPASRILSSLTVVSITLWVVLKKNDCTMPRLHGLR